MRLSLVLEGEVQDILNLFAEQREAADEKRVQKVAGDEAAAKERGKGILDDYKVEKVGQVSQCLGGSAARLVPVYNLTSPQGKKYRVCPDKKECDCEYRRFHSTCKHIEGIGDVLEKARMLL